MNYTWTKIIPRDLFNESKLLKCWGQLALKIHDGIGIPRELRILDEDLRDDFGAMQCPLTGNTSLANIHLVFGDVTVPIWNEYNSKAAYPMWFEWNHEENLVFDEDGELSEEFTEMLNYANQL